MNTTYEIIDDELMTKLSIRSNTGFLALIDTEIIDDSDGLDGEPTTEPINNTPPRNESGVVNVLEALKNDNTITIKNIKTDNKEIDFERGLAKYKKEHPDDPFPTGHYILELP